MARFAKKWIFIALALHVLAAIFSIGYQNSDEHFQILEFLNHFLGRTPVQDLAVEYAHQARPWFQVFLYWVPTELLRAVGVENPFIWALSYRLVSALIGWLSVAGLILCVPRWIKSTKLQKVAIQVLALTWYLPVLHARHSSENLSGSLFIIGLCWLTLEKKNRLRALWACGILWGLAFEARFQVGLIVAGAWLWLAFSAKRPKRELATIAGGILVAVAFGTVLDSIGYGHPVFVFWNYFHINFIEGYLSAGGNSPIWDYFRRIWTETWPILGFVYFAGVIVFWFRYPRHVLTWSYLPFFVFHTLIGHKETRFLFPLASAAPLCLVMAVGSFKLPKRDWPIRMVAGLLIALNFIALVSLTFFPMSPIIRLYQGIYDRQIHELWYKDQDPYVALGIPMHFYRPDNFVTHSWEKEEMRPHTGEEFWLAAPHAEGSFWLASFNADTVLCKTEVRTIPEIASAVFPHLNEVNHWALYHCGPPTQSNSP